MFIFSLLLVTEMPPHNPFMQNGVFYPNSLDRFISTRSIWLVFIVTLFCRISVLNANSVVPDQTLQSAVSDFGLHCLPMSHCWMHGVNRLIMIHMDQSNIVKIQGKQMHVSNCEYLLQYIL